MESKSGMIGASMVPLGDLSGASDFMAARAALFLFSNSILFDIRRRLIPRVLDLGF